MFKSELYDIFKAAVYFALFPGILSCIKDVYIPDEIYVINKNETISAKFPGKANFSALDLDVQRAEVFRPTIFDELMGNIMLKFLDIRNLRSSFISQDYQQMRYALDNVQIPSVRLEKEYENAE